MATARCIGGIGPMIGLVGATLDLIRVLPSAS